MQAAAAIQASETFNARARAEGWPSLCDPELAFTDSRFRVLLSLWHGFAVGDRLPRRSDFTPLALKALLRNVAIYERVANGTVRYRVAVMGSAFADAMGDWSGRFIDEAMPSLAGRWQATLDAAFQAQAPLRFIGRSDAANNSCVVAEFFEAPLAGENGAAMVLAAGHFAPRPWMAVRASEADRIPHAAAAE
jgi:hypothetical protein